MRHRRRAGGTTGRIRPGVLLLVVGVLLAIGAPVAWSVRHQDPALKPIDQGIAVQLAQAPAGGTDPSPTTTSKTEGPRATSANSPPVTAGSTRESKTVPIITTRPGRPSSATQRPAVRRLPSVAVTAPSLGIPTRLAIPAIGINAVVDAVGVNDQGEMAVPAQVQEIGWYRYGAAPGSSAGSVVMSGHVDSAVQGLGAFSRLGELKAGDVITVSDAAGRKLRYHVVGREAFDKKVVPLADLFSRSGAARLTLITCGGDFDSSIRSYLDNIVVTAVPG